MMRKAFRSLAPAFLLAFSTAVAPAPAAPVPATPAKPASGTTTQASIRKTPLPPASALVLAEVRRPDPAGTSLVRIEGMDAAGRPVFLAWQGSGGEEGSMAARTWIRRGDGLVESLIEEGAGTPTRYLTLVRDADGYLEELGLSGSGAPIARILLSWNGARTDCRIRMLDPASTVIAVAELETGAGPASARPLLIRSLDASGAPLAWRRFDYDAAGRLVACGIAAALVPAAPEASATPAVPERAASPVAVPGTPASPVPVLLPDLLVLFSPSLPGEGPDLLPLHTSAGPDVFFPGADMGFFGPGFGYPAEGGFELVWDEAGRPCRVGILDTAGRELGTIAWQWDERGLLVGEERGGSMAILQVVTPAAPVVPAAASAPATPAAAAAGTKQAAGGIVPAQPSPASAGPVLLSFVYRTAPEGTWLSRESLLLADAWGGPEETIQGHWELRRLRR